MSKLLFSLRGVPEDEAFEIKELLTENHIEYYETSAGNWGISMPALWLSNNEQIDEAEKLLDAYHHSRAITQREIYNQLKIEGKNKRLGDVIRKQPLLLISYLGVAVLILYVSIRLLFEFGL